MSKIFTNFLSTITTLIINIASIGTNKPPKTSQIPQIKQKNQKSEILKPQLPISHDLQYLACLKGGPRKQYNRTGHVSGLYANHIRILVIPEIGHFLSMLDPGIPDDSIREIILLDAHLPAGYDVRYDVLLRCILVDAVCPFSDRHHIPSLMVNCPITGLVYESATVQSSYLASAHVRNFKIGVEQHVEAEGQLFTRIVNSYVEV